MSTLRFIIWIRVRIMVRFSGTVSVKVRVMVRFSGTVSVKVRVRVSVNFRFRGTVKVRDSGMLVLDVGLPSLQF